MSRVIWGSDQRGSDPLRVIAFVVFCRWSRMRILPMGSTLTPVIGVAGLGHGLDGRENPLAGERECEGCDHVQGRAVVHSRTGQVAR